METYRYKDDCRIERDHGMFEGRAVVADCEGNIIFHVDANLPDSEVWAMLDVINHYYASGYKEGLKAKAKSST